MRRHGGARARLHGLSRGRRNMGQVIGGIIAGAITLGATIAGVVPGGLAVAAGAIMLRGWRIRR